MLPYYQEYVLKDVYLLRTILNTFNILIEIYKLFYKNKKKHKFFEQNFHISLYLKLISYKIKLCYTFKTSITLKNSLESSKAQPPELFKIHSFAILALKAQTIKCSSILL